MHPVIAAAFEWLRRQARISHPHGRFDNATRWYPADDERCSCCEVIRSPSRAWNLSLNKHCRSIEHVANLFNVNASDVRAAARRVSDFAAI